VSRDAETQIASDCECGSPLRWEHREDYMERRSLALCSNDACGLLTVASPQGVHPEQGLESFLLGQVPVRRYLPPWMRWYWKATNWGFLWRPHHEVCPNCDGEVTAQLALPPLMERQTDPYQVVLCLACGATGIAWWLGERVAIAIHGGEWKEPSTAVVILKRVLEERAAMAREDRSWDTLE
jgi:hypothetical protein